MGANNVASKVDASRLCEELFRIRKVMGGEYTPQQLEMLLLAYVHPGITQTEISDRLDMPQASVSRNVLKLGKKAVRNPQGRFRVIGAGLLVTRQDEVYDSRRLACFLTSKGEELCKKIVEGSYYAIQGRESKCRDRV